MSKATSSDAERDTPEIDTPIYLHFLDLSFGEDRLLERNSIRYRWYVIEEKTTPTAARAAVAVDLPEELMITTTNNDRVSHLRLPHLDFDVTGSLFFVCKSRMFFMGGRTIVRNNGILAIDLWDDDDPCWDRYDNWTGDEHDVWPKGALVHHRDEWDWIYVIMSAQILRFDPYDVVDTGELIDYPFQWPAHVIASTGVEMIIYNEVKNELASFHMDSLTTRVLNCDVDPCDTWFAVKSLHYKNVVVGNFVVCFAEDSPLTWDYSPGLYVYDMSVGKWLSQPVQGLENDGVVLPVLEITRKGPFHHGSLVRVRRKVDKLALLWAFNVLDNNGYASGHVEVHWSKFILNTEDPTCFHVEDLQSGIFSGGVAYLINCYAG